MVSNTSEVGDEHGPNYNRCSQSGRSLGLGRRRPGGAVGHQASGRRRQVGGPRRRGRHPRRDRLPEGAEKFLDAHKDMEKHLDKIKDTVGLDVRKDLHGVTFYGKEIGKHTGVAIVQAKFDQKLLLDKAEKAPDHKVVKVGSYDVHTWTHKGHGETRTVAGAFYKDDRLVLASSLDEIKAAINVLDGKASGSPAAPLSDPVPAGATVIVRATGLAGANLPASARWPSRSNRSGWRWARMRQNRSSTPRP